MKKAVLLHLYYHDLWMDMTSYLKNIKSNFDLYVNLIEGNIQNEIMEITIKKSFPSATVLVSENRGRDIGGFLRLMDLVIKSGKDYDVLLLMHTKKSPQAPPYWGLQWRSSLLNSIVGSPEQVNNIMHDFDGDKKMGMAGAKQFIFSLETHGPVVYHTNRSIMTEYCDRFNLNKDDTRFVAGTCFWVRANIFKDFFSKNNPIDIADEMKFGDHNDDVNGSRCHSWERLFGYLVTSAGYNIKGY